MSGADRIKVPKGRDPFRTALAVAAVAIGLVASLGWWLDAPLWRLPLVIAVSAALGWGVATLMMKDVRRARRKGGK